jgi:glutathione S-transferase
MKLFYSEIPNGRKVCAVAKYLNLPVEYIPVDLTKGEQKKPEFMAINPNGKIPTLYDGNVNMWESNAIMAYLSHKAGSDLWPSDTMEQIEVLRWLSWDTAHFSRHAGTLFLENFIKEAFKRGAPNQANIEEAEGFFRQFAAVLNDHLANNQFVANNKLSIADFAVGSQIPTAKQAKLPLDGMSNIMKWHDRMMAMDAWSNPFPALKKAA